jgi:protein arginine N-methyltransferase 1
MLEDHKRTGAYYQACMQNRSQFANKVVLDVGTGSGILAIFAAKAGAKKVYAVEATSMAISAKRMVEAQGLEDVIEVIQGVIESVEIPEKVDIIISEWMGYFLLRESMLDSVVVARDRFLKPDGALYPSHARLFMAPIRSQIAAQRSADFQTSMHGWGDFIADMREMYGVEMDCLSDDYRKEQKEYYSQTSAWTDIHPSQMVGPPALIKAYDLKTVTLEELKAPLNANFTMSVTERGSVDAYCGFFDTEFKGSVENPADFPITLSTAPDPTGATHWGQQSFFLQPSLQVSAGDKIVCELEMRRRKENHRLLEVHLKHRIENEESKNNVVKAPERVSHFIIE